MNRFCLLVACLGIFLGATFAPARAGDAKAGFLPRVHKGADGPSKYVLFVPHGYTGDKAYPLILFLHGAGELDWIVMKTLEKHRNRRYRPAPGFRNPLRVFYLLRRKPMARGAVSDERFQSDRRRTGTGASPTRCC